MKGSRAAVLLLPLALAGCATRGSVNRVRQEIGALGKGIDELRRAQEQSGQELASLVRELKAGDVRLAQLMPEVAANAEAVRKLSARLDQAEQALARPRAEADNGARDSRETRDRAFCDRWSWPTGWPSSRPTPRSKPAHRWR